MIFDINWDIKIERLLCTDGNHSQDESDSSTNGEDFNIPIKS